MRHSVHNLRGLAILCGGMAVLVGVAVFLNGEGGSSVNSTSQPAATWLGGYQGIPVYYPDAYWQQVGAGYSGYPVPLNCWSSDPYNKIPSPYKYSPYCGSFAFNVYQSLMPLGVFSVHPPSVASGASRVLYYRDAGYNYKGPGSSDANCRATYRWQNPFRYNHNSEEWNICRDPEEGGCTTREDGFTLEDPYVVYRSQGPVGGAGCYDSYVSLPPYQPTTEWGFHTYSYGSSPSIAQGQTLTLDWSCQPYLTGHTSGCDSWINFGSYCASSSWRNYTAYYFQSTPSITANGSPVGGVGGSYGSVNVTVPAGSTTYALTCSGSLDGSSQGAQAATSKVMSISITALPPEPACPSPMISNGYEGHYIPANAAQYRVTIYGSDFCIRNYGSSSYLIPTKTPGEFAAFLAATNAGLSSILVKSSVF